ncbi:MAG: hypothetical protein EP329_03235 [Deltaproteobacteria bacterium]|nr:MAG: hypothetical protein EP329_03235 [Deltaproteobacteria bacterium]
MNGEHHALIHVGELTRRAREARGLSIEALATQVSHHEREKTLRRLDRLEHEGIAGGTTLARVLEVLGISVEAVFQAAADAAVWRYAGDRRRESDAVYELDGSLTRVFYPPNQGEDDLSALCDHVDRLREGLGRLERDRNVGLCRPCEAVVWIDPEPPEIWRPLEGLGRPINRALLRKELDLSTLARLWRSGALRAAAPGDASAVLAVRAVGHRASQLVVVDGIDESTRQRVRRVYRGAWVVAWLDRLHGALGEGREDLRRELWRRVQLRFRATVSLEKLRAMLASGATGPVPSELRPTSTTGTRDGAALDLRRAVDELERFVAIPISAPGWSERRAEEIGVMPIGVDKRDQWFDPTVTITGFFAMGRTYARRVFKEALETLPRLEVLDVARALRALTDA